MPKTNSACQTIVHSSELSEKRTQLLWAVDFVWSDVRSANCSGVCMFLFFPSLSYKLKICTSDSFQLLTDCLCDCRRLIVPEWPSDILWNFSWVFSCLDPKTAWVGSSLFGSSTCPRVADSVVIENSMEARKCHLSSSEPLNLQLTHASIGHRCNQQRRNIVQWCYERCVKCVHINMKVQKCSANCPRREMLLLLKSSMPYREEDRI